MRIFFFTPFVVICFACSSQPGFKWAGLVGGNASAYATASAVDSKGNIYLSALVKDSVDLDPGPGAKKIYAYDYSAVVIKLDSSGILLYSKLFSINSSISAIAVDKQDNVYAFGQFSVAINLNPDGIPYNLNGANDLFICKWNANGNLIWGQRIGNAFYEDAVAMKIDGVSNIVMTGTFRDTLDLDPGNGKYLLASNGGADIFVCTFNTSGYLVSAQSFGGVYNDYPSDLALAPDNSVYLSGRVDGTVDFDPAAQQKILTAPGGSSFISKLDQYRNFHWAFLMEGSPYGGALEADVEGNVYYGSAFDYSIDADPGPVAHIISSLGQTDGVVVKFDSKGNFIRVHVFGGPSYEGVYDVATDEFGGLYASGSFYDEMDADPGGNIYSLTNMLSAFIVKLDSSGDFACAGMLRGVKDIGYHRPYLSVANSAIVLCGSFWGTTDFDPGTSEYLLTAPQGKSGVYLTMLSPGSCCVESVQPSQVAGSDKLCAGDAAELTVSDGKLGDAATWKWYEGACGKGTPLAVGTKVSLFPKQNTTYYVRAEGICNTTACFPVNFILEQKPTASVNAQSGNSDGLSAGLVASGGISYSWFPSAQVDCDTCSSVTVFQEETTTYCAVVTAENGCSDTACLTVALTSVFVPNAFSPNNDCINDVFTPVINGVTEYNLSIFNRWGDKIFETADRNSGWTGKYKDGLCEAGIYSYLIRYTSEEDREDHQATGKVLLIR